MLVSPQRGDTRELALAMLAQAAKCQAAATELLNYALGMLHGEEHTIPLQRVGHLHTDTVLEELAAVEKDNECAEVIRISGLTQRQNEVLQLLARGGLSNRQIARKLGLAESTVKAHLHAIFVRLQAKDRTDAVIKAFGGTLGDLRAV
ncbi:helix-turn-helix domain-containing protein [Amycolatopsis azurea]|uniref:Helix-turn-helix transcriptional regulator n=1 Tax=Amycolatopsis azurea DSM 43854 TaxID=1238180 RepID=M2QPP9_9PSEU|nr:LuxR C-terminal-related transcriptional regulator [Amycolatopsis azurea]EMD28656.1 hypothetical protein C791_0280 [Amycolatopsis azurea DSM 43854]OOC08081.1 helix-turn-helix transcriptional regulator [Amycolatopsis azurea DSM 43854]